MHRFFARSLLLVGLAAIASPVAAQSFFTTLLTDPTVGVDRGSASHLRKVEEPTGFLTFTSEGARDIGPIIAGIGGSFPGILNRRDQIDLVAVLSGPSADGDKELLAGGLGYRFDLGDTGTTLFLNGTYSDIQLGSEESLALGIEGRASHLAFGARQEWKRDNHARVVATLEISGRDQKWDVLGINSLDESIRTIRASVMYDQGLPFMFRKRFAVAVTKGLAGFGASPTPNPLGSAPGVTADFVRIAGGVEMSVPLSRRFYINAGIIAQWTNDSLPVSQRCGYQTNEYARGFDQAYVNGDRCFGGRVEFAYNLSLPDIRAERLRYTQTFFGVDGGRIEDMPNPVVAGNKDGWSSLSAGVRTLQGNFVGEVSVSRILDQPIGTVAQRRTRFWLRTAVKF